MTAAPGSGAGPRSRDGRQAAGLVQRLTVGWHESGHPATLREHAHRYGDLPRRPSGRTSVHDLIDQGTPGLWSVILGIVPEKLKIRGIAGHMRLIIGYNDDTKEILYSDSWGPGNELKRMPLDDAWTITTGLNAIEPL